MGWNPYTDQKNSAFVEILTGLFPEQTKTLPRIIIWSVIFIADLILAAYLVYRFDLFALFAGGRDGMFLMALAVGTATALLFWLQGKIFYGIANLFQ